MMRSFVLVVIALLLASALGFAATPGIPRAQVIVLSNSSPHVTVVDAQTHRVVKTADIPQMSSWTWNDDNNYYDGRHLWLGLRNPDTSDVEVILFDLETLQVTRRIPLGKDAATLYIGKLSRRNRLLVSKHGSGEIAVIDTKTFEVVQTVKLPVDGGVACDIDLAAGPGSIERALVPTDNGNTVLSIDADTLQVLGRAVFSGTRPFMLTTSSDGRQAWVQERTGNSMTVLNARTLQVIRRIPTGRTPIIGTFSPDGRLHFTGHAADTEVMAHDTKTFREVWRARVGSNPDRLGVHPAGTFVYATISREGAIAVIDARSGRVVMRIALGTNPTGIFVRRL
jgi:DNA-binding beta-propeller fold protein YncE